MSPETRVALLRALPDPGPRRAKVLHVATRHRLGGAERNLNHTVGWQLDRGYEVHVAVGAEGFVPSLPDGARAHLIENLVRNVAPRQDVAAFGQLRRLITDERFDIVHTHQSKAGIVGRAAAAGRTPLILHTLHMASFGPAYGRAASELFRRAEHIIARHTDLYISVGLELAQRYIDAGIGSPDRHVVIHSPIEVERFQAVRSADATQRLAWRRALSVPAGVPHIVSVGALDRRKRHHLVIDRLAPLLRTGEITLTIAGDGPEAPALADQAAALGVDHALRIPGFVADVPALLGSADLVVHASELEGVPQTVIQALAAGVPVVVTEMEGLREVGNRVRRVDQRGTDLVTAITEVLRAAGRWRQTPPDAYHAWTRTAIDDAHEALFSVAEEFLERHHAGTAPALAAMVDIGAARQPVRRRRRTRNHRRRPQIHAPAGLVAALAATGEAP